MEFWSRSWKVMEFDIGKYVCCILLWIVRNVCGKTYEIRQDVNLL